MILFSNMCYAAVIILTYMIVSYILIRNEIRMFDVNEVLRMSH